MTRPIIGIASDVQHVEGKRDAAFAYLTYVEAVRAGGGIPVLIPPQPENAAELVAGLDGILLAGGFDCDPSLYGEEKHPSCSMMDPRRQANDLELARASRSCGIPTLGICLGMQMMNVAGGGSLIQDIDSEVETSIRHASKPEDRARHDVRLEPGTRLAAILSHDEMNVNSSHHQAVRRLGDGLRITAWAPDGVVEGIEDPQHPFYQGVQWHPEDLNGDHAASALFGAFIAAARDYAEQKKGKRAVPQTH